MKLYEKRSAERYEAYEEMRCFSDMEIRVAGERNPRIEGYAAVFNTWADIDGMFREKVLPGAFKKTIKENDIRALWNHDRNYVLGRNKAGTLQLSEDSKGLRIGIDPGDITWANDLMKSMRRGDINQMSIGFNVIKSNDNYEKDERELVEIRLFDVSVVTFPAYPTTSAEVRSKYGTPDNGSNEPDWSDVDRIYEKIKDGSVTREDWEALNYIMLLSEPVESHSEGRIHELLNTDISQLN